MSFENKEICEKCGGACCKRMPACASPLDFDMNRNKFLSILKTGEWAIDWLDKNTFDEPDGTEKERAYFIRPAVKGVTNLFDNSKKGECIFLEEKGCRLSIEQRPIGCRLLEPKENFNCILHFGNTKEAALSWMPYKNLIEEIGINDPSFHSDSND